MANTNPQAIQFANSQIRPMSDQLYSAYLSAKKVVQEWNAQQLALVIPNDSTIIADGSAVDGRPQITDAQATNIINRCIELISWFENGLVASPFNATVNNNTLNTVVAVQVNGKTQL